MDTQLAMQAQAPLAQYQPAPRQTVAGQIGQLLDLAREHKLEPEGIVKMLDVADRLDIRKARQDWIDAMRAFQAECPDIEKTHRADIDSRRGTKFSYTHEKMKDILDTVRPILSKYGLGLRFNGDVRDAVTATTGEGGQVVQSSKQIYTSIVVVWHVSGHEEATTFSVPTESAAGMSPQQKVAAAAAQADRHCLKRALGIIAVDPEDGAAAGDFETVTPEQVRQLEDLLHQSESNIDAFKGIWGVDSLSDMSVNNYEPACKLLQTKIDSRRKGKT